MIQIRKLEYRGHLIRNEKYALLQLIIQGKIEGVRGSGGRRDSWLKNLLKWNAKTTPQLVLAAASKPTSKDRRWFWKKERTVET